jgi:hypothetical protein
MSMQGFVLGPAMRTGPLVAPSASVLVQPAPGNVMLVRVTSSPPAAVWGGPVAVNIKRVCVQMFP